LWLVSLDLRKAFDKVEFSPLLDALRVQGISERPDTMAKYFSDVQWKVQFANLCPDGIYLIHSEIPISVDAFSHAELHRVLDKLKNGKASGYDDIPPDFWRALRSSFDGLYITTVGGTEISLKHGV